MKHGISKLMAALALGVCGAMSTQAMAADVAAANVGHWDFAGTVVYDNGFNFLSDYAIGGGSMPGVSDFTASSLFTSSYVSSLGADGYGSITWTFKNTSGGTITGSQAGGYLSINDIDGEYFTDVEMQGAPGAGRTVGGEWSLVKSFTEQGIPAAAAGYHGVGATLGWDDKKGLSEDYVPSFMALGMMFDVDSLNAQGWKNGDSVAVTFTLAAAPSAGSLFQYYTSGSDRIGFYFSGNSQYLAAPVPEPSEYAMMLAGLMMIGVIARRRRVE